MSLEVAIGIVERLVAQALPVAGSLGAAYFGYKATSKKQTEAILGEIEKVKGDVQTVQVTASDSNEKIVEIQDKLKLHDEAHLVTMRMRLDRDIRRALRRGYTSRDEFYTVDKMYKNYQSLGGNGYIERLVQDYHALEIRATLEVDD